jgi:outer membrane protein insertion porin family
MTSLEPTLVNLNSTKLFNYVDLTLDYKDGKNVPGTATAVLDIDEKRATTGYIGLNRTTQTGETSLQLKATHRNLLGRGELLSGELALGNFKSLDMAVDLHKPLLALKASALLEVFNKVSNNAYISSYQESSSGFCLGLKSLDARHHVKYTAAWRALSPSARPIAFSAGDADIRTSYCGPSLSVLDQADSSVLSSVGYTFTQDTRNTQFRPSRGSLLRACCELAGLGGDVTFSKLQLEAQTHRPLSSRLVGGLSVTCGVLDSRAWPFAPLFGQANNRPRPASRLPDRFLNGGPLSVRGFEAGGLGPREADDALGGELSSAACLRATYTPESWREVGVQVFANAGSLTSLEGRTGLPGAREWLASHRLSVGAGLLLPLDMFRIEVNAVQPVRAMESDRTRRFQLGFGMTWL